MPAQASPSSFFLCQSPETTLQASAEGIKVGWKAESSHVCSGCMSAFLKASGRGWSKQSIEMPMKPNSKLILSETKCKQGRFSCAMWMCYLSVCGMNGWLFHMDKQMNAWERQLKVKPLEWNIISQSRERLGCFSAFLCLQRTFPFMSRISQSQRAELSSWPVRAHSLSHSTHLYHDTYFVVLNISENIILPHRLEKFVFGWQDCQQNVVGFWWWHQGLSEN